MRGRGLKWYVISARRNNNPMVLIRAKISSVYTITGALLFNPKKLLHVRGYESPVSSKTDTIAGKDYTVLKSCKTEQHADEQMDQVARSHAHFLPSLRQIFVCSSTHDTGTL